ncbi:glycosyltransferase family 4 protein [Nakamurella endophytica]|uniref:Glycosyl transferase n=1 Tax=Nakamurella endophytica TaxID=1748367 RepID=A0A917WB20_9ACTN|nr:glycosyltransferase family 4 protein [Nakamurella endophytica]GGL87424.1 glycosyl transferase [Nakamurella endophytica]
MDRRSLLIAHPSADLYGSDRVMLEAIDAAVGRGWQVHVTVPGPGPLVEEVRLRGGDVSLCPTPVLRKSALRPAGLVRLIGATVRGTVAGVRLLRTVRPQVLYTSTLTIPLWIALARLSRRPVLVHVHESERAAPRLLRRLLATPLLVATAVVVNSEFSRSVLADSFRSLGRRSRVLYNGVPGPEHAVPPRPAIAGPARLLFVGRLSPRKGPQVAVEVVRLLTEAGRDVTLDVVGSVFPGYEWFEEQLRRQIREAGLLDRVRLQGFRPDVFPSLAAADVLLVPSQGDEPFGNIAVEGALAARPVLVSTGSGLDEAVQGMAAARRLPPDDATAWADEVVRLLEDWDAVRGDAVTDAVTARSRYAPEVFRTALADRLDELAGTPAVTR